MYSLSQSKLGEGVKYIGHYPNVNSYKRHRITLLMLISQSKLGEGAKYIPSLDQSKVYHP